MLLIDGVPAPDALARDRGLAYGDGVFETIALRHGRPLCRDLHLARLQHGCRALGFAPPAASTLSADCQLLAEQREHGVIKIIVTRGDGGRGYRPPPVVRPAVSQACTLGHPTSIQARPRA
jgi:4-amino-4-deoxychorismate lyase